MRTRKDALQDIPTVGEFSQGNKCGMSGLTFHILKTRKLLKDRKREGGHLVFENPALSIPENSKAKHPTFNFESRFQRKDP